MQKSLGPVVICPYLCTSEELERAQREAEEAARLAAEQEAREKEEAAALSYFILHYSIVHLYYIYWEERFYTH